MKRVIRMAANMFAMACGFGFGCAMYMAPFSRIVCSVAWLLGMGVVIYAGINLVRMEVSHD